MRISCSLASTIRRAYIFLIEMALAQYATRLLSGTCEGLAVYCDESERRLLDFNLRLYAQLYRLLNGVCILKSRRIVVGGTSKFFSLILNAATEAAPQLNLGNLQLIENDDVEDLVENADDVPEFWFDDGNGKPYVSTDRRNTWCYERCLSDDNKITQKDVYNPGPWPYEEVDYSALRLSNSNRGGPDTLDTIEEGGEEDEW